MTPTRSLAAPPPMAPSREASRDQLELARVQGRAARLVVDCMTRFDSRGEEVAVGDFLIGYAVNLARGMYVLDGDTLRWRKPGKENAHIEVSVRDAADGRFVPGLNVEVAVERLDGTEVGTHVHPFVWHPWMHHYGRNWILPHDGHYTLRIRVDVPDFPRHDRINGQRFLEAVEAIFRHVLIRTGHKKD